MAIEQDKLYDIDSLYANSISTVLSQNTPSFQSTFQDGVAAEVLAGVLSVGKRAFSNTDPGYRLGMDATDGLLKFFIGNSTDYLNWDGSALTISGAVTAGGTITGATIQTATSGTRFVMTSTAFQGINSAGVVIFEIIISGANAGDVIMGDDATGSYALWDNSAGTFEVFADNIPQLTKGNFGGNGADGVLAISSGTTTVNLAGARYVVLNYTSISITGTAKLAFSNPHTEGTAIVIKSQGNTTITSSDTAAIDVSALGASGGTGGVSSGGDGGNGTDGQTGFGTVGKGDGGAAQVGGPGGTAPTPLVELDEMDIKVSKLIRYLVGAGGGGGEAGEANGGSPPNGSAGGRGGGVLILECAGALNFTTGGIKAEGEDTATPSGGNPNFAGSGAGGGGGGGTVLIFYNTLTANTGTISVVGGTGAVGQTSQIPGTAKTGAGGGGGAGATAGTTGGGGGAGAGAGGTGGNGGNGISGVFENTIYS